MSPIQLVGYMRYHGFDCELESTMVIKVFERKWNTKTEKLEILKEYRLRADYCAIVGFVHNAKNIK